MIAADLDQSVNGDTTVAKNTRTRANAQTFCQERSNMGSFGILVKQLQSIYVAIKRKRSRSSLPRPYIWRLIVFRRLTLPSVRSFDQLKVKAAFTAS